MSETSRHQEGQFADLLGVASSAKRASPAARRHMSFSCLLFSDVRDDVTDVQKYAFAKDIALFADREGCTAVYIPERHFSTFGSIYPNPALLAAYLIPATRRVRFRTAGIVLPLHHPLEIVEWWAMNDILSGGRVDLGFASGWNKPDFVLSPSSYEDRRRVFFERIPVVQSLWRGEAASFPGPNGELLTVTAYPRPLQPEVKVWILAAQSEDSFFQAGARGYNVFTMLYGADLDGLGKRIASYRRGRSEAMLDPSKGTISLMLHALVHPDLRCVEEAVEEPFRAYIATTIEMHLREKVVGGPDNASLDEAAKKKILDYSYRRYFSTAALFGPVERAREMVDHALEVGVDEIACLVDFGADYGFVKSSFPHLQRLIAAYL